MKQPIDTLRLCITLATVLYLAFISESTLSFLLTPAAPGQVTIEVTKDQAASAADPQDGLAVDAVIADGKLLRWDSTHYTNEWELQDTEGQPVPHLFDTHPGSATLTFQARRFVAVVRSVRWSGVMRVIRDGRLVQERTVPRSDVWSPIAVDDPGAPRSGAVFVGALILFAACAWRFGPWSRGRRSLPWLVFFLTALHLLYWATQPVATNNDSEGYLDAISTLFSSGTPAYFPPGYPVFLALVGSLAGGHLGSAVTLIQHGMAILAAVWLYLLLRRVVSEGLALVGGILAGSLGPTLTLSQSVLSETATCFAMAGALYFAVRATETGKIIFTVLAGALMGWGVILRVVPLVALSPAICLVYLSPLSRNGLRRLGISAIAALAIVLLPIAWCGYKSGYPGLTDSTGLHLYNRVIDEQKLVNEDGPSTRRLEALLAGKDLRNAHWIVIQEAGLDYEQAEHLMRKVSLEGISKYPARFLLYSPGLAWRTLIVPTQWIPDWSLTMSAMPRLENPPLLAFTASDLDWHWDLDSLNLRIWPILCWIAVAGGLLAFWSRQRPLALAIAWIPVGYLLAGACVEYFNPRFNSAIVPFIAALAMLPFDLLRRLIWKPAFSAEPVSQAQSLSGLTGVSAAPRSDAVEVKVK
jgi:hypothetical protein